MYSKYKFIIRHFAIEVLLCVRFQVRVALTVYLTLKRKLSF